MLFRCSRGFLLAAAFLAASTAVAFAQAPPSTQSTSEAKIRSIGPILTTVGDMDRSIAFYERVLTFEKVSDQELAGEEVEHLFGVFGARVRLVQMKLGEESIELAQFLAPR
jgi:hypothetical protein